MPMTAQEVFNTCAHHLLTQKRKSVVEESSNCLYRGPNGLKCAAGPLIPDSLYSPRMEGFSIDAVMRDFPEFTQVVGEENQGLITNLQYIHDQKEENLWRIELRILARKYRLDDSVIDTVL